MRIGSLFSGIGGLEMGLEWSGLGQTVWQVEQNPFCRAVLAKHWPLVERFEDVKTVGVNLPGVDLICGGFPCQDISGAGKGAGLAGSRSGLWFEYARIIQELRPEWVVVENVASGAKRWVDQVREHLGQLGYETLPIPLSARDVGAPHLRQRIFLVAHSQSVQLQREPYSWPESAGYQGEGPLSWRSEAQEILARDNRAGLAESATDAQREQLRIKSGGGCRPRGQGAPLASEHGEAGYATDALRPGREGHISGGRDKKHPAFEGDYAWHGWAPIAPVCGVDDGFPDRAHRLKALGNAVVPQCAEVIGHVIAALRSGL